MLPFLELLVEDLGVVDDNAVEEAIELLGIDPVGALDLAVEPWSHRLDVDVANTLVEHVPVKGGFQLFCIQEPLGLET